MKVLSIDIGSSSARVMVVDSENDYEIKELYRVSHTSQLDENSSYRWKINNVFDLLKEAVDKALIDYDIKSIGVCSWGVDYGVVGTDGKMIDAPYSYRDERTNCVFANMPKCYAGYSMFEKAGIYPNCINTVYHLLSDKQTER